MPDIGFNIFLFIWLRTNHLLPVLGIRSLVLRRKLLNVLSPGSSTQRIMLLNQSVPLISRDSNDCDRHSGSPYSAGLTGWYFPGSCLKRTTSSHVCPYRLDAKTVSLSFPTGFFLSYLSDAGLNKLYSCLLIEKCPRVWRLQYKYSDWSTFINDVTFRLTGLVLKWYRTKPSA